MALIAGGADKLKKYILNFGTGVGADDYAEHVASAALTASQSVDQWQGGSPTAIYADVSTPVWLLTIRMSQANKLSASLFEYLLTNAGTVVDLTMTPVEGGRSAAMKVVLGVPQTFGGDIGSWAEAEANCAVQGQPVFTHPA